MWRLTHHFITSPRNLKTTSGLLILMHGPISLPDETSCDKVYLDNIWTYTHNKITYIWQSLDVYTPISKVWKKKVFLNKNILHCRYSKECLNETVLLCTRNTRFNWWVRKYSLSYDVASGSEITPCDKIDKPLMVYRFTGNFMTYITTVNNVAYIVTRLWLFYARNEISK